METAIGKTGFGIARRQTDHTARSCACVHWSTVLSPSLAHQYWVVREGSSHQRRVGLRKDVRDAPRMTVRTPQA